jgi:ubiquinone/menaquinone biosynthesis C-methylase UbiE
MTHLDRLLVRYPEIKDGRILDIGTGDGEFVLDCYRRKLHVDGIEVNAERVARIKKEAPDIRVVVGIAEKLPYHDASFDFINMCELIEHVEDPKKVLTEATRVLAPSGRIYLSFPNRFSIYDTHYHLWFVNWLPRVWADGVIRLLGKEKSVEGKGRQALSEMHYYTWGSFRHLAAQTGLRAEDSRLSRFQSSPYLIPLYLFLRPWYFRASHVILSKS